MILVDSDVLIAHLRGIEQAKDWLLSARRATGRLAISAVSATEIAGGRRAHDKREVTRLLASVNILPISERVAWKAAELMRSYRQSHSSIGLGDYLIAATVSTEGLQLATLNTRHFPMFPDLRPAFELR